MKIVNVKYIYNYQDKITEKTDGNETVIKGQLFVIKKRLGYKTFHKIRRPN